MSLRQVIIHQELFANHKEVYLSSKFEILELLELRIEVKEIQPFIYKIEVIINYAVLYANVYTHVYPIDYALDYSVHYSHDYALVRSNIYIVTLISK